MTSLRDSSGEPRPVQRWWEAEPQRLQRDLEDLSCEPDLIYVGNGTWSGALRTWPFDRPKPWGLDLLVPSGLTLRVATSPAHPLVEPAILPDAVGLGLQLHHRGDHRWHVSFDGRLCLTRSPLDWCPEESIVELLLKAASWRCELALLQLQVVTAMSENGIVTDASRDHLFAYAAHTAAHLEATAA